MNMFEGHKIMQSMLINNIIDQCEEKELLPLIDQIGNLIEDSAEKCSFLGYWKKLVKWHLSTKVPIESLLVERPVDW